MMSNVCTVLFKGVIFLDFGLKGHKIVGFKLQTSGASTKTIQLLALVFYLSDSQLCCPSFTIRS